MIHSMLMEQRIVSASKMDIGSKIKFYRLQRNMKQEELAKGIISVSYLSKIENNLTAPSNEVLKLLCDRLDVNVFMEEDKALKKDIMDWYKCMETSAYETSKKKYEELLLKTKILSNTETYIYFLLFEVRYFLMIREHEKANNMLNNLQQYVELFDLHMHYYYQKFYAIYTYRTNDFVAALEQFKKAEELFHRSIHFEKEEEADLYYLLGLAFSQTMKIPISITYTSQALSIYQSIYETKRCAECHILLGISYRRIGEYERSEKSYILAQRVADTQNDKYLKALLHHNIGKLYAVQNKSQQALDEFTKSYNLKQNASIASKLNSIYCIAMEYEKLDNLDEAKKWVTLGKNYLTDVRNLKEYEEYIIYFTMLEKVVLAEYEFLDEYFQEKALPYFRQHDLREQFVKYAEKLAIHFEACYKYKKSSYYYALCFQELKQQTHY